MDFDEKKSGIFMVLIAMSVCNSAWHDLIYGDFWAPGEGMRCTILVSQGQSFLFMYFFD